MRLGQEPGRRRQHLDALTSVINQDDLVAVLAAADCQQPGCAGSQVAIEEPVTAPDRFEDARGDVESVQPAVGAARQPSSTAAGNGIAPAAVPVQPPADIETREGLPGIARRPPPGASAASSCPAANPAATTRPRLRHPLSSSSETFCRATHHGSLVGRSSSAIGAPFMRTSLQLAPAERYQGPFHQIPDGTVREPRAYTYRAHSRHARARALTRPVNGVPHAETPAPNVSTLTVRRAVASCS
jgi:hypothetical protein